MSYGHDAAGRRTSMTYADSGLVVGYVYNSSDLTEIRENPAGGNVLLATYVHDNLGRRTSLTRGNGAVTSYAYDNVSRLSQLVQNLNGTGSDLTLDFTHNPAGEIATNTRSNDSYAYTGHANANVTGTANGLNQLTNVGGVGNSHDARGNVSAIGGSSYGYSSENMLTSGPSSTTLGYDPLNRLHHTAGGSTTRFGYDGIEMVAEYNGSNALQRRYVFGPGIDEPLVWYEGSGTSTRRYFHADERGSVVAVSDASGDVVTAVNRYDEYGNVQGTLTGRFGYTGQAWLPELGMAYYRNRIYNPAMGRFMQTDPIGFGGGMNLYAYVGNNPVNFTDPMGLEDKTIVVTGRRSWLDRYQQYLNQLFMQIELRLMQRNQGRAEGESCDSSNPGNCDIEVQGNRLTRLPALPPIVAVASGFTCELPLLISMQGPANDNFRQAHPLCRELTYRCLQNASDGGSKAAACRTAGRICDLAYLASIMAPQTFGRTEITFPDGGVLEINVGAVHIVRRDYLSKLEPSWKMCLKLRQALLLVRVK